MTATPFFPSPASPTAPPAGLLSARRPDGGTDDHGLHGPSAPDIDRADRRIGFLDALDDPADLIALLATFDLPGGPQLAAATTPDGGGLVIDRLALAWLRAAADRGLSDLGRAAGLSPEVLTALETGRLPRLGPAALAALAAALDVAPDLLTAAESKIGASKTGTGGIGDGADRLFYLDPAMLAADVAIDHVRLTPDIRADHDPGAPVGILIDPVACLESLRPERIAAAIIATNGLTAPPVPVAEIAYAAGIDRIVEGSLGEARGALLLDPAPTADGGRATILYRRGRTGSHDLRTIGHELGHFLMRHHRGPFLCSDRAVFGGEGETLEQFPWQRKLPGTKLASERKEIAIFPDSRIAENALAAGIARTEEADGSRAGGGTATDIAVLRQLESEANRFANHLLLPERFLVRSLAESDQHPLAFAATHHQLYGLTIEPMIRRLVERCPAPVVVVKLPAAPDQPAYPIWNGAARQRFIRPDPSNRVMFAAAVTAARRTKGIIEVPIAARDWLLRRNGGGFSGDTVPAVALCEYPGQPFERTWVWHTVSPV